MIMGTDYRALARIIQRKTSLPVFFFDTNGMKYYDEGAAGAFLELARQIVRPPQPDGAVKAGAFNIIGATPLDIGSDQLKKLIASLEMNEDFQMVSCWSMGSALDDIARAAHAKINIVIAGSGLQAVRFMEKEYGIPYVATV